jgi:hypothetical protein
MRTPTGSGLVLELQLAADAAALSAELNDPALLAF